MRLIEVLSVLFNCMMRYGKESACNEGRPGSDPWVGKIPWRKKWQPTPSLGGEDSLEKEMATHSNILAWRIPCTEEPGGLQVCTRSCICTAFSFSLQVIFRALSPPNDENPYSAKVQEQLKITNLRVQLLKRQSCPCQRNHLNAKPQHFTHYAVYDFIVKGSCFCNGHADQCIPVDGFRPVKAPGAFHVVSCKCNGHADACHFDISVWEASGNRSGGVCNDCQHNTEGQHCQRCKPGFYRDLRRPFSAPDACKCKCECKEQVLGNSKAFCGMKYSYVLKIKILSAHDKGSHAEVNVKIKKVLKSTKLKILRGKRTLYPESWTNRGCTCPILNPGLEYLVAGHEDVRTGKLVVNMKSFVQHWKPSLGRKVMDILKRECKQQ
ncbi:hypothetical protein FD755_000389 [Muntiacus reevesi]|uniref:Netrin-4 n=2 Tax=Muntiacus TaxID=9885 RepID=A0A5J5N0J8_MUNRE|nr:hypothetical protein FD754_014094 [Muntiacus muntjak]KAB0385433.1 hypothetical protein FD755_000389 [Muntiacus reevesi]